MANIYIEPFAAYINAGDAKNQIGFGSNFGIDVADGFKIVYQSMYSLMKVKEEIASIPVTKDYSHMTQLLGIEYIPPIPFLSKMRLKWKNSLLTGYSSTKVKIDDSGEAKDSGISALFLTGIEFDVSQHISPFIQAGWQHSFYFQDFKDSKIYGIQVIAGIKFSIFRQKELGEFY